MTLFSFAWFGALQLARESSQLSLPSRLVFCSWFAMMCVVLLLSLWQIASRILSPELPAVV
jgi:hypothetical protein